MAEGGPGGEAEVAPEVGFSGKGPKARGGAAKGGEGRPVEKTESAGEHVRVEVFDGSSRHQLNFGLKSMDEVELVKRRKKKKWLFLYTNLMEAL